MTGRSGVSGSGAGAPQRAQRGVPLPLPLNLIAPTPKELSSVHCFQCLMHFKHVLSCPVGHPLQCPFDGAHPEVHGLWGARFPIHHEHDFYH